MAHLPEWFNSLVSTNTTEALESNLDYARSMIHDPRTDPELAQGIRDAAGAYHSELERRKHG